MRLSFSAYALADIGSESLHSKKEGCFESVPDKRIDDKANNPHSNIKVSLSAWDTDLAAANPKYLSVNCEHDAFRI